MRTLSIPAAFLLLAAVTLPAPSTAVARPGAATPGVAPAAAQATDVSAQSTRKKRSTKRSSSRRGYDSRASAGGRQIACTQLGCHPIPRGCRVVPGKIPFTWDPSGFDDVICPYPR